MVITFNMGHTLSGAGTGAAGILSETGKNREIGNEVIRLLRSKGHTVINCTVDNSNNDLAAIVALANAQASNLFVSLHLNAGGGRGTETFVYNEAFAGKEANRAVAKTVNDKIVASCGFANRGVKEENFYVLRNTVSPAILIEVCFVDSQEDADKLNCSKVAQAIAEGITGQSFGGTEQPAQPTQPSTKEMFRVRLAWNNPASQKGAYGSLDNAIIECNKYAGYEVYNSAGTQVYPAPVKPTPVPTPSSGDREIKRYGETGTCTVTTDKIYFRNKPYVGTDNPVIDSYSNNESVYYDLVVITEQYVWVSWIGGSGTRRYMPIKQKSNNESWANCV